MKQFCAGVEVSTVPLSFAQLDQMCINGETSGLYVSDPKCRNLVSPRNLSVRYMPRAQKFRVTYKVALWWRSVESSNASDQSPFYLIA